MGTEVVNQQSINKVLGGGTFEESGNKKYKDKARKYKAMVKQLRL
jgi:hypothetical protein